MPAIILSDNGATSGSAGLKTSGGNDGVLLLQTTTSGGTPTTAISISNTQVVTYTNQPTYTGGTANGVLYLNGSKAVTSGTALVFDGTNLGVGVTPVSSKLHVKQTTTAQGIKLESNANDSQIAIYNNNADPEWRVTATYGSTGSFQPLTFWTSDTKRLTLDTSGNLGLGVTPSAWGSNYKAIESAAASNFVLASANVNPITLVCNGYATNSGFLYKTTGAASLLNVSNGSFQFFNAASGTAGNAISFTQAMTLDASGRLSLGTTATSDFTMTIYNTSSTSAGIQCQNSSTGTGSNNGFYVGVSGSGTAGTTGYVWNCENDRISFGTNNIDRARITAAGDFDLYITAPKDGQLRWTSGGGGAVQAYIYANGNPELIAQCGGSGGVKLTSGATSWVSASDIRSKDIIEHITDAVTKVATLSSIIYNFKDDEQQTRRVGLVAQELLEVLPEAVYVPTKEGEFLGVRYAEVVPLLVAAIKELKAEIDVLKGQT